MAGYCVITPCVYNKKHERVPSKLYKSLLEITHNREDALNLYMRTLNKEFEKSYGKDIVRDEYGEATVQSLFKIPSAFKLVPESKVMDHIQKTDGSKNDKGTYVETEYSTKNVIDAHRKANEFNRTSPWAESYVETVDVDHTTNVVRRILRPKTVNTEYEAKQQDVTSRLYSRIIDILDAHGVSIGVMEEEEKRLSIDGVTDFRNVTDLAEGFIELIRLGNGQKGLEALPEEFAHVALEMIGPNNLKDRLLSLIENKGLAKQIIGKEYDQYYKEYGGDKARLAREAAGKLVKDHFLDQKPIPNAPYKDLLTRIIDAIKNFLRGFRASDFQDALAEARTLAKQLSVDLIEGDLSNDMSLKNIVHKEVLYSVQEAKKQIKEATSREQRNNVIAKELKDNITQLVALIDNKNKDLADYKAQKDLMKSIDKYKDAHTEKALTEFIDKFISDAEIMAKSFEGDGEDSYANDSPVNKALRLENLYMFTRSYSHILTDMYDIVRSLPKNEYTDYKDCEKLFTTAIGVVTKLEQDYKNMAVDLMYQFFGKYWGNEPIREVKHGKMKGTKYTLQDVMTSAISGDISSVDRWVCSMAHSKDEFLRLMDSAVKDYLEKARRATIEYEKRLLALGIELEQAGINDTSFMFERDDEGRVFERYVSEVNSAEFHRRENAFIASLKEKYGENPKGEAAKAFVAEKAAWFEKNLEDYTDENGIRRKRPRNEDGYYHNPAYDEIMADPAKKKFYEGVMAIKEELDNKLPPAMRQKYHAVLVRKGALEKIKSSSSFADLKHHTAQMLWEKLSVQSDDEGYANKSRNLLDFDGNRVRSVPILYRTMGEHESMLDMSTDIISSMILYADMANNYQQMNAISNFAEIGYRLQEDREIKDVKSGGAKESVMKFAGNVVKKFEGVEKGKSGISAKLRDYIDMMVYGEKEVDEGGFDFMGHHISFAKVADTFNWLTSWNSIAANWSANISNITTGMSMMEAEAWAGRYVTRTDLLMGDKAYFGDIHNIIADVGKRVKTSNTSLFLEKFDVLQKFKEDIRNIDFHKSTMFSRLVGPEVGFYGQDMGEHWMQARTALALANHIKLKLDGKDITLLDAYERQWIDENNHALGARLVLKKGVRKPDGTKFTEDDETAFVKKAKSINQGMHGIYNEVDKCMAQRYAIGRMVFQFRKWIIPNLENRFNEEYYDYDLDQMTEGYYRTFWRYLGDVASGLKEGQIGIIANFEKLDEQEQANVKKALFDLGQIALLALAICLLYGPLSGDDDDDDNRSYGSYMLEYQARRLYAELGALSPIGMGPEGMKILKSPMAGVNTLDWLCNTIELLYPSNYETFWGDDALITRGRYKGWSKAQKLWLERPLMAQTISRNIDLESRIQFLAQ